MKKLLVILLALVMLAGCGSAKFTFTTSSDNTRIEVNTGDGETAETPYFYVGNNREVVIEADLSSGQLEIDFAEATVFDSDPDAQPEVIVGIIVKSVTVSGNDKVTIELPQSYYVMELKTVGETKGTVKVNVVKK